jgi:hypothetical protein
MTGVRSPHSRASFALGTRRKRLPSDRVNPGDLRKINTAIEQSASNQLFLPIHEQR